MCNAKGHRNGCPCGFGGIGHSGRRTEWFPVEESKSVRMLSKKKDMRNFFFEFQQSFSYTIPNARCPKCSMPVFFYQNDYGSKVYFDSLGKPWPKHGCFDDEQILPIKYSESKKDFSYRQSKIQLSVKDSFSINEDFSLFKLQYGAKKIELLINKGDIEYMAGLTILLNATRKLIEIDCYNAWLGGKKVIGIRKEEAIQMGFEKYFTMEIGDVVSIEINPLDEIGTKFPVKLVNTKLKVRQTNLFIRNADLKTATKNILRKYQNNIVIKARAFKIIESDMMFEKV